MENNINTESILNIVDKIKTLPELYATEEIDIEDKIYPIRLYSSNLDWAWYPLEYGRSENICFGLVAGDFNEYGYFSLIEIASKPVFAVVDYEYTQKNDKELRSMLEWKM